MRGTALIINGTADHVHVLARIRPAHSAAQIARVIKTNSSRWVHEKGHIKFAWGLVFRRFRGSRVRLLTQGLRPGLHSYAASRLLRHEENRNAKSSLGVPLVLLSF